MQRTYFPGMQLRAVAYAVQGDRIGVVPDVLEMTVTTPRGEAPTLSLSYAPGPNAVRGSVLEGEVEVAVEATFDGDTWEELPDARFVTQKTEHNLVNDGTDSRKVEAIHVSDYMKEALVWSVPEAAKDKEGKFKFLSKNAGEIIGTVWQAAAKRGWGEGLTLDATTTTDSANQRWAKVVTLYFDPSISILQIVDSLRDLGMIDTVWQGRTLKIYNADTTQARDLTASRVWPLATTLTGAPEAATWADMCTDVLVKGESGRTWLIHNDTAPKSMRRVEKVVEAGGVELEATARLVAEATLKSGAHVREEIKREWAAPDVHLLPWQDYRLGDWMMVERQGGMERLQVAQISVTQKEQAVSGHTTFGTVLDSLLGRLTKRTKGIVGLATTSGTGVRPNPPVSKNWPVPPQGLTGTTRAVVGQDGWPTAVVELQWGKVDADALGTKVDVTGYEVSWQNVKLSAERSGSYVTKGAEATTAAIAPLEVGVEYRFWVRAQTQDGVGAWSQPLIITTATDVTPPPVPPVPRLSQTLGVLNVGWLMVGENREAMPADFAGAEVSVQLPGVAPGVFSTMPAPVQRISLAGLEMREYEVCMRTYDRAGNRSAWGRAATITLKQNIDADAIAKQVEDKLKGSDAMQQAAREGTLKEMRHLTDAMTQVATNLVSSGPVPPDSGTIGSSMWIAPDGRIFVLRAEGDR